MSKRLSKSEAAAILGVHEKTLERHAQDPEFVEATGFKRNKMSGRVSFDEMFFRAYAANVTGNDDLRTLEDPEPAAIDAEEVPAGALVRTAPAAGYSSAGAEEMARAFILPHKIFLTLHEAQDLTGLPMTKLRKISQLICGRRLISSRTLEEQILENFK